MKEETLLKCKAGLVQLVRCPKCQFFVLSADIRSKENKEMDTCRFCRKTEERANVAKLVI